MAETTTVSSVAAAIAAAESRRHTGKGELPARVLPDGLLNGTEIPAQNMEQFEEAILAAVDQSPNHQAEIRWPE